MNATRAIRLAGAVTAVVAACGIALARTPRGSASADPSVARIAHGFSERAERDVQIRVWHQALDADPSSALANGQLAALHLQRAREGGGWDDYLSAEKFARASLGKRTQRNAATASTLVSVLLAQHRFAEARVIATELVLAEPETPQYRATLAEVAMELGDDTAADSLFRSVWRDRAMLTIAPRLARWLELNNHVSEARKLLRAARDDAIARRDVAKETQAWFHLRVGELELRRGHTAAASTAFEAGLELEPDDPRLLAAMARHASALGNWKRAIEWGERAIAVQLDPATLGVIGDAYAAMGNQAKASEYFRTLEVAVSLQPGAFHRAWSLHLLEHGLNIPTVLQRAEEELRERKDVYAYDILALALEKSGRHAEAVVAMRQALRLNTPDPLLTRHALQIGVPLDPASSRAE